MRKKKALIMLASASILTMSLTGCSLWDFLNEFGQGTDNSAQEHYEEPMQNETEFYNQEGQQTGTYGLKFKKMNPPKLYDVDCGYDVPGFKIDKYDIKTKGNMDNILKELKAIPELQNYHFAHKTIDETTMRKKDNMFDDNTYNYQKYVIFSEKDLDIVDFNNVADLSFPKSILENNKAVVVMFPNMNSFYYGSSEEPGQVSSVEVRFYGFDDTADNTKLFKSVLSTVFQDENVNYLMHASAESNNTFIKTIDNPYEDGVSNTYIRNIDSDCVEFAFLENRKEWGNKGDGYANVKRNYSELNFQYLASDDYYIDGNKTLSDLNEASPLDFTFMGREISNSLYAKDCTEYIQMRSYVTLEVDNKKQEYLRANHAIQTNDHIQQWNLDEMISATDDKKDMDEISYRIKEQNPEKPDMDTIRRIIAKLVSKECAVNLENMKEDHKCYHAGEYTIKSMWGNEETFFVTVNYYEPEAVWEISMKLITE